MLRLECVYKRKAQFLNAGGGQLLDKLSLDLPEINCFQILPHSSCEFTSILLSSMVMRSSDFRMAFSFCSKKLKSSHGMISSSLLSAFWAIVG